MLVQAKRLKRDKSGWKLDVSHGGGRQQRNLLDSADFFDVPAIYGVYMGGLIFRRDLACTHGGMNPCTTCKRMAITMMPALSLSPDWSQDALAEVSFAEGVPLEDLGDPGRPAGFVRDVNFRELEPGELRSFLTDDQLGPREVAKHIFKSISIRRSSQHSAAVAERLELAGDQVFYELPRDRDTSQSPTSLTSSEACARLRLTTYATSSPASRHRPRFPNWLLGSCLSSIDPMDRVNRHRNS